MRIKAAHYIKSRKKDKNVCCNKKCRLKSRRTSNHPLITGYPCKYIGLYIPKEYTEALLDHSKEVHYCDCGMCWEVK
jgi:hypothetical protein